MYFEVMNNHHYTKAQNINNASVFPSQFQLIEIINTIVRYVNDFTQCANNNLFAIVRISSIRISKPTVAQ